MIMMEDGRAVIADSTLVGVVYAHVIRHVCRHMACVGGNLGGKDEQCQACRIAMSSRRTCVLVRGHHSYAVLCVPLRKWGKMAAERH